MQLPEDASDEDLYQWFITSLAKYSQAAEVDPKVIRVKRPWLLHNQEDPSRVAPRPTERAPLPG